MAEIRKIVTGQNDIEVSKDSDKVNSKDITDDSILSISDLAVRLLEEGRTECVLANCCGLFVYNGNPAALQELLDTFPDGIQRKVLMLYEPNMIDTSMLADSNKLYVSFDTFFLMEVKEPGILELQRYGEKYPTDRCKAYGVAGYLDFEKEYGIQQNPTNTVIIVSQLDYGRTQKLYDRNVLLVQMPDTRELRLNLIYINGKRADETTKLGRLMQKLMKDDIRPEEFEPEFPEHAKALRSFQEGVLKKEVRFMSKTELMLKKFGDQCEARGVAIGEARGVAIGEARGVAIGEARGVAIGEARGVDEMLSFFQEGIDAMKEVTAEALEILLATAAEKAQPIRIAAERMQTNMAVRK